MLSLVRLSGIWLLMAAICGCGNATQHPDRGPFGAAVTSPLLAPYAGEWAFEFEKTLDARRAAGAPDDEIERTREFYTRNPDLGALHGDLIITGNTVVCGGLPVGEYRLFAIHPHPGYVCGKAWHHEDRFDPGDMSKNLVRLSLRGEEMQLDVRMQLSSVELDDPDLRTEPPVEDGSAADCHADSLPETEWTEWTTYIFTRKR